MAHLWSGRFDSAPDEEVFEFQSSFAFDRRLFEDDVNGSLAWAEGLASAGVLSAEDATAVRAALEEIRKLGGTTLEVAQNDNRVEVSYHLADKAAEKLYPEWRDRFEEWKLVGGDFPYHYLGSAIWFNRMGRAFGEAMLGLMK